MFVVNIEMRKGLHSKLTRLSVHQLIAPLDYSNGSSRPTERRSTRHSYDGGNGLMACTLDDGRLLVVGEVSRGSPAGRAIDGQNHDDS